MNPGAGFSRTLDRLLPADATGLAVMLSGGPDSTLLARLAAREAFRRSLAFLVLHVNHRLRALESDREEAWVRALCARLGWPLLVHQAPACPEAGNRAAWARRERREFAKQAAPAGFVILTGHQRDDQRESALMALDQGKLPWGLAGMPDRDGRWLKPLLGWDRQRILAALEDLAQDFCQDSSNRHPVCLRNRVRLGWIPLLEQGAPGAWQGPLDALVRTARKWLEKEQARAQKLLEMQDLRPEPWGLSLERQGWERYHGPAFELALEALGRRLGAWQRSPSGQRLESLRSFILTGRTGAWMPMGRGRELSLARNRVHLGLRAVAPAVQVLEPGGAVPLGGWRFRRDRVDEGTCREWFGLAACWTDRPLVLRTVQAGDRLRIGPTARKCVASLVAEAGWSRPERLTRPVLACGSEVLWIPGLRRAWQPGFPPPDQAPERVWVEECPNSM